MKTRTDNIQPSPYQSSRPPALVVLLLSLAWLRSPGPPGALESRKYHLEVQKPRKNALSGLSDGFYIALPRLAEAYIGHIWDWSRGRQEIGNARLS